MNTKQKYEQDFKDFQQSINEGKKRYGKYEHLPHKKKPAKAKELIKQGFNQKQISMMLGITPQTVGRWLNPYKKELKENVNTLKLFDKRLNELLNNKKSTSTEIKTLVDAMRVFKDCSIWIK